MLYGVQCRNTPDVLDKSPVNAYWPTATDVTSQVQSVTVYASEGSRVTMAGLKLKNNAATFRTTKDYQMVTIELGYQWSDGTTDLPGSFGVTSPLVFIGYIVTPGKGARIGPLENCDVVAYDPMIRLRDEKAEGLEPDFQMFTPKAAVEWLAKRAGFHADQLDILGSDSAMFTGYVGYNNEPDEWQGSPEPANDSLLPAFGSELIASVEEYAKRDAQSEVYCTPDTSADGNLFKLHKTNGARAVSAGILWEIKEDAAETEYHLYNIDVQHVGMDGEQYADCVVARGQDEHGAPIGATADAPERRVDPTDADWNGGWRHTTCISRNHLKREGPARVYAVNALNERKRRPQVATIVTDLLHSSGTYVQKGDRFRVTNAAASGRAYNAGIRSPDTSTNIFRIESIRHFWDDRADMPRTAVIGRSLD